jgi:hypothetical protein
MTLGKELDITMTMGYEGTEFTERIVTLRFDMNVAVAIRRKEAFGYVASITDALTEMAIIS